MVRKKYGLSKQLRPVMADADDAGESKTTVVSNNASINPNIYQCCKRCARKRHTRHLPIEMVFMFLLHIPAHVLHDVMRHVCREWNLMIRSQNFIRHHLRNSPSGIVIQERSLCREGIYVEMRRGCLEICKFDCEFKKLVETSCNGLVLAPNLRDKRILNVTNPLTKQWATLPPFFLKIGYHASCGLAFVEASMEYKVVHAHGNIPLGLKTQIAVLTVGVDKLWRKIDVEHLSLTTRRALMSRPLVTGGYMHWILETSFLKLNVETETICQFSIPLSQKRDRRFLPMGSNLSVVYEPSKFRRDVWEINSETGEWTMLFSFDLKPITYRFKDLVSKYQSSIIPIGWLVVREVLVFSTTHFQSSCVAYNIKTGEIHLIELGTDTKSYSFQPHVNSLVWLEAGV